MEASGKPGFDLAFVFKKKVNTGWERSSRGRVGELLSAVLCGSKEVKI